MSDSFWSYLQTGSNIATVNFYYWPLYLSRESQATAHKYKEKANFCSQPLLCSWVVLCTIITPCHLVMQKCPLIQRDNINQNKQLWKNVCLHKYLNGQYLYKRCPRSIDREKQSAMSSSSFEGSWNEKVIHWSQSFCKRVHNEQ